MRVKLIYFLLLIFCSLKIFSQGLNEYRYYDSLTYAQYLNSDWRDLRVSSGEAIRKGYDYYYMRMRAGISKYEKGNYMGAIGDFRKALEFNAGDPVAQEYIYYSYLNMGKEPVARAVSGSFSESLKGRVRKDVSNTVASFDYMYSNSGSDDLIAANESIYGYGLEGNLIVPRDMMNFSLSLSHLVSPHTTIYHSASFLTRTNWLYYNDGTYAAQLSEQNVNQFQYYFSPSFSTAGALTIRPFVHVIFIRYPMIYFQTMGTYTNAYTYTEKNLNFAGGMSLEELAGPVEFRFSASYSYMNYTDNVQFGAEASVYPSGNSSFYFGGGIYRIYANEESGWRGRNVYSWLAGAGFGGKVWIELSGLNGDIYNFSNRDGYVVFNGPGQAYMDMNATVIVPFGTSGVKLYFLAGITGHYAVYSPEPGILIPYTDERIISTKYLGGLTWTF